MYRAAAEGGMLIELPEHIAPRNPDGTLQRKVYDKAVGDNGPSEIRRLSGDV